MSRKLWSFGIAAGVLIPNIVLAESVIIEHTSFSTSTTAIANSNKVINNTKQYNP